MTDHSVNAVLDRMSFTRFSYRRSENRVFPVVAYANDLLPNREFRHQPPPRVVIRVSLKASKFRASGRVKFIALRPPAPSWGRPEAIDTLERAAGAETALTLVNCTNPMLFQCPAAEHGGIPPSFKSRGDAQARGLPRGAARICAGS